MIFLSGFEKCSAAKHMPSTPKVFGSAKMKCPICLKVEMSYWRCPGWEVQEGQQLMTQAERNRCVARIALPGDLNLFAHMKIGNVLPDRISITIGSCHFRMRSVSGVWRAVRQAWLRTMVSTFGVIVRAAAQDKDGGCRVLRKPFKLEELKQTINLGWSA